MRTLDWLSSVAADRHRRSFALVAAAAAVMAAPGVAVAQATLRGRVVDENTSAPLGDAQVQIVGTSLAVSANADGRYVISNAPPGSVDVRVTRVGYGEQRRSVRLDDGAVATLDFALKATTTMLDPVVATATGIQRKVELGSSIATIDAARRVEETSINTVADLLVAKAAGVIVTPGNMTGSAPVVRMRGLNSLSLSNAPLVIVDGVPYLSSSMTARVGGTNVSFLNSLAPEDIESIEIARGPSAATLYGTGAANGVIVVSTKQGRAGNARWNWFAEHGQVEDRNTYPPTNALWGHSATKNPTRCQLATMAPTVCVPDSLTSLDIPMDRTIGPLGTGANQTFGGSVGGGTAAIRYFVSGDLFNETGPYRMPAFSVARLEDSLHTAVRDEWLHPEALQRENARVNVSAIISPALDLSLNIGLAKSDQRLPQTDNNTLGLGAAMLLTRGTDHAGLDYNPLGSFGEALHGYSGVTPAEIFQYSTTERIQRSTTSATALWHPLSWMQNSATVGMDLAGQLLLQLCRTSQCPNVGQTRQGLAYSETDNNRSFGVKVASTSFWNPRPSLSFKSTVGGEYENNETDATVASGTALTPGSETVNGAATKTASSTPPTAAKTLGAYVQEEIGARDRLFFAGTIRTDKNSAFGTDFRRVFYPGLSLSWLLSDESFFRAPRFIDGLRLRAAYGVSGVQPNATDALRTFAATTVNILAVNTPGLIETTVGNPGLKPETSAELEGGFELRAFGNRVNADMTYYRKQTHDALVSLPVAASAAPPALAVRTNLGSVKNEGVEMQLTTRLLDTRWVGWTMTVAGSHNSNQVVSLGVDLNGQPNKTIGTGATRDSAGLPVNAILIRNYTFKDANGDGIIQASEVTVDTGLSYKGYSAPRDLVSIQQSVDLFRRGLRLNALVDYKGGYNLLNNTATLTCGLAFQSCAEDQDKSMSLARQARAVAMNYGTTINGTKYTTQRGFWEDGQFWRLRELSATWDIPSAAARTALRAHDGSLTFGARNLHVWTKYTGIDPEASYSTLDVPMDFVTAPPRTYFTFRLNLHY
jgi:TonB-linked SusC/RagA family outer membrane protein